MKGLDRDKNLHLRVSSVELEKYKTTAKELGLTVSALVRFATNKQLRLLRTKKEDEITLQ